MATQGGRSAASALTQSQRQAVQAQLGKLPKKVAANQNQRPAANDNRSGVRGSGGGTARPRITPLFNQAAAQKGKVQTARFNRERQAQARAIVQKSRLAGSKQIQASRDKQRLTELIKVLSLRKANGKLKLASHSSLVFGEDDLVYGPSAGGKLVLLRQKAGGKLLTDLKDKREDESISEYSIRVLKNAAESGRIIHFDLTNMANIDGVLKRQGNFSDESYVTATELRFIKENWNSFISKPKFYKNEQEVEPPWLE